MFFCSGNILRFGFEFTFWWGTDGCRVLEITVYNDSKFKFQNINLIQKLRLIPNSNFLVAGFWTTEQIISFNAMYIYIKLVPFKIWHLIFYWTFDANSRCFLPSIVGNHTIIFNFKLILTLSWVIISEGPNNHRSRRCYNCRARYIENKSSLYLRHDTRVHDTNNIFSLINIYYLKF